MLAVKPTSITHGLALRTTTTTKRRAAVTTTPAIICARTSRAVCLKERGTKRGTQRTYAAVGGVTSGGSSNEGSSEASLVPQAAEIDEMKMNAIATKLNKMSKNFKRWGYVGFWSQLTLSVVSVVILLFSIAFETQAKGITLSLTLTWLGAILAFVSVFWAIGYTRLALKMKKGIEDPDQIVSKEETMKSCETGIKLNIVGMFCTLLGAESTVGLLTAKSLTQSVFVAPMVAGGSGSGGLVALDIFLLQSCINVIFSHFAGLLVSLWLLNLVTKSN